MSQPSLSGGGDRDDRDESTPPVSPFISERASGTLNKPKSTLHAQKSSLSLNRKYQDSSLDADDTESELVAIPESDLSESTLHNSAPSSFDDGIHLDEMSQPMKSDQLRGKMTTANLATAQVALTTLGMVEKTEEKSDTKKGSRLFMKLNSLDKSTPRAQTSSSSESSRIVTKCSIQEGVRMMVTPSIFMTPQTEKPQVSQSIHTQKPEEDVTTNGNSEERSKTSDSKDEADGNKTSDSSVISESEASKSAGKLNAKGELMFPRATEVLFQEEQNFFLI